MYSPKVSIIIPNYNHAPYLKKRIDSVLNQTYTDFEVFILDDKSSDNSRAIIEDYRNHPKVSQIIFNETNSGSTFKQWKKGIELAKGEWIWIAESDDWCELDFIEKVLSKIIENHAVIGFSQSKMIDQNDRILYERPASIPSGCTDGETYINNVLIFENAVYNASMVIFKKSAIDEALFSILPTYKYAGDWLFFGSIVRKGNVIEVHEFLNYFRTHSKNVTNTSIKKGLTFTEGLSAVYLFTRNMKLDKKSFAKNWKKKWKKFTKTHSYSLTTKGKSLWYFLKILFS